MAKKNRKSGNSYRPNVWGMIRDVAIASLNKGQFAWAIVASIFIIIILRMPSKDVTILAMEIVNGFKSLHLVGWAIGLVAAVSGAMNAKRLRKIHTLEMRRVAKEKKELQEALAGHKLPTSN